MNNKSNSKPLWIIKLGGSIITDDQKYQTPNKETITNILLLLTEFSKQYNFLIVHGAGSYGHPLAKAYQLSKGFRSLDQYNGLLLTHESMLELNNVV